MALPDYASKVPTATQLTERLSERLQYWQPRNQLITKLRDMVAGKNAVPFPSNTLYQPKVMHTFLMAAALNEKRARFGQFPILKAWPESIGIESQSVATRIEQGFNWAMYEMDRNSATAAWDQAVADAILLGEGVECIERAPAAFWPEIIAPKGGMSRLEQLYQGRSDKEWDAAYAAYKALAGAPIRSRYVPLEDTYPTYESEVQVELFELETRALRQVLANKQFNQESLAALRGAVGESERDLLATNVSVVRYCNQWVYAYFALLPSRQGQPWPAPQAMATIGGAQAVLLHSYEHKLGRTLYNNIPGRFGLWTTAHSAHEPIAKAMLELNQYADEVASQMFTNVRAKYWPNLKWTLNPDLRAADGGRPRPPRLREGEPIALYIGEDLAPVWRPADDPMATWIFGEIGQQFNRLAGSPALFGERQPGVDTGYHQQLQLTQSERLDEKLEEGVSWGAVNRATLYAMHILAMDESVIVTKNSTDPKTRRPHKQLIELKPSELRPLPRFDARVKKPRPVDFLAMLRAARDASANRHGEHTPMLSDDTIYDAILGIDDGSDEKRRILLQRTQLKLLDSGVIEQRIAERMNLQDIVEGAPAQPGGPADPALQAAIAAQKAGGPGAVAGGQQLGDMSMRRPGGTPMGAPQPEQALGSIVAAQGAGSMLPEAV